MMKTFVKRLQETFFPARDYIKFSGSILPLPERRKCGRKFDDDTFFVQSAEHEAQRLIEHFDCTSATRVLDIGCGEGRLPIGCLRVMGKLQYLGLDVQPRAIEWCKRYIERQHPSFRFHLLNVANERYNRGGLPLNQDFKFDVPDHSVDIIYLFSVFSHMNEADMRIYLADFRRILTDGGNVFFTTFVEENVPKFSINPENYIFEKCSGPLHIVRYEKYHLFSILEESGFVLENFTHRTEVDQQSALYLKKRQ